VAAGTDGFDGRAELDGAAGGFGEEGREDEVGARGDDKDLVFEGGEGESEGVA